MLFLKVCAAILNFLNDLPSVSSNHWRGPVNFQLETNSIVYKYVSWEKSEDWGIIDFIFCKGKVPFVNFCCSLGVSISGLHLFLAAVWSFISWIWHFYAYPSIQLLVLLWTGRWCFKELLPSTKFKLIWQICSSSELEAPIWWSVSCWEFIASRWIAKIDQFPESATYKVPECCMHLRAIWPKEGSVSVPHKSIGLLSEKKRKGPPNWGIILPFKMSKTQ